MEDDQNKAQGNLIKACQEAFRKYPNSCSHAAWHVIRQYRREQEWMDANDLVNHLSNSADWKQVQLTELSKLACEGVLVVGGAKEGVHGHVIVVYPGQEKTKGGYQYFNDKTKQIETLDRTGSFARAMSTSQGSWPGAMSNGDKTVADAWSAKKFKTVRFWKYVGPTNNEPSLLTPKTPSKTPQGLITGQKQKRRVKKFRVKVKPKEKDRWGFKTFTDCFGAMNHKWQRAFK